MLTHEPTPEERLKHGLDGTFTQIDREGRIRVAIVEKDFIPRYRGLPLAIIEEHNKQTPWTPEEDELLLALTRQRKSRSEIAWYLDRSEDSLNNRLRRLQTMQGIRATRSLEQCQN